MAHADYECCAICDCKMYYSSDAGSKETICTDCAVSLAQEGVFCKNVADLIEWMTEVEKEKGKLILSKIGFSKCCYGNDVDKLYKLKFEDAPQEIKESTPSASHNSAIPKCNHDMHWREQYICAKCGYVSISQPRGCGCTSGE